MVYIKHSVCNQGLIYEFVYIAEKTKWKQIMEKILAVQDIQLNKVILQDNM